MQNKYSWQHYFRLNFKVLNSVVSFNKKSFS